LVVGLVVVFSLAAAAYAVVQTRAAGGQMRQSLATVVLPGPGDGPEEPPFERWLVGRVAKPVDVHVRPDTSSRVRTRLTRTTPNGYPTLVLVDTVREVGSTTWYRVWLAKRPNGSRGWIREGRLGFYFTSSKIVIDLSQRELTVYRRGNAVASYPVAVGRRGLETPTGFFFVNQKLRPPSPNGAYGALAIGISAFQPKLPDWPQGGPVAIHGTNQDSLIGKAVSHGCVRMHNKHILAVNKLVPAGSPVIIQN
jgi:lipoprotein-anchoring transpeptidase ErfK/SrfK